MTNDRAATIRSRFTGGLVAVALLASLTAACAPGGGVAAAASGSACSSASLLDTIHRTGELIVGVRTDDPPHGFIDASGAWVGFDVDVAQAIARLWGVKLTLVKVDELTRISFLQNGRIELAVASISKTRKRGQVVDFSETYFFSTQSFLVRAGAIASLQDLVGKRVGADRGSSGAANWTDWLTRHGHPGSPDIVLFGDKHAAADAVRQGSIAGWAEDYEILASFAKNDPGLRVLNDPGGIGLKLDGIAMRKNDSTLRNAVDTALQQLAADGEYDAIYTRWFGPASSTPVPRQGVIEIWPHG